MNQDLVYILLFIPLLYWLPSAILELIIGRIFAKKIIISPNSNVSCRHRKWMIRIARLRHILFIGLILFIAILYVDELNLYQLDNPYSRYLIFSSVVLANISIYFFCIIITSKYSEVKYINGITKHKVKKDYILFLRGFGFSKYGAEMPIRKKKDIFSEQKFLRRIALLSRVYSIGKVNDVFSPSDSQRVILDDETWQNDVEELMINANAVVVLVNSTPNCLVQINKALEMKQKVVFLINTRKHFENLCHAFPQFETISNNISAERFYMYYNQNGDLQANPFKNKGNSYWDIISKVRTIAMNNCS